MVGRYASVHTLFPGRSVADANNSSVEVAINNHTRELSFLIDGITMRAYSSIGSGSTRTSGSASLSLDEASPIVDADGNHVWKFNVQSSVTQSSRFYGVVVLIGTRPDTHEPFAVMAKESTTWNVLGDTYLQKRRHTNNSYFIQTRLPLLTARQGYYRIPKRSPVALSALLDYSPAAAYSIGDVVEVPDGSGSLQWVFTPAAAVSANDSLNLSQVVNAPSITSVSELTQTPVTGSYYYHATELRLYRYASDSWSPADSATGTSYTRRSFRQAVIAEIKHGNKWAEVNDSTLPLANLGYHNLDPEYCFTNANIENGIFTKSTTRPPSALIRCRSGSLTRTRAS